jgi:hypothetical protein
MARMSGRQFDRRVHRRYRRRFGREIDLPGAPDRLTRARRDEIAELAEAVAGEHCPSGRVEPGRIARAGRITISFGPYGDAFDGMLEHRGGRFHIYCSLGRLGRPEAPRARFTLAHELGHYYIDEHRCALASARCPAHRSLCDYESSNRAEQEADHFAANLLMPRARFLAAAGAAAPGLAGIGSLAETFATSLTSTAIRYAACDAAACAVVKWASGRYAWKWLSSATFRARFRRTVEAPQELAADSPTARALAGERPEGDFFEAGTTASAWFPRVKAGEFRDVILIEQAAPLGRYGVLTFLRPQAGRYRFDEPS